MLEHCIDGSIKSAEVDESKDLEILETNWKTFSQAVWWIGLVLLFTIKINAANKSEALAE